MRMRSMAAPLAAALIVAAMAVAPVVAITNGTADGEVHPYVGVVVFLDADGVVQRRCSGSLLSPTVFLTSGHCSVGMSSAEVRFDEHAAGPTYVGNPVTSPDGSMGVVVFGEPVPIFTYADLPAAGVVDALVNKTPLVLVGYGVTEQDKVSGNPIGRWNDPMSRMSGLSALVSGNQSGSADLLKHSNGPGGGSAGGCFHDSGGPILRPDSNVVLAINAFVSNYNCTGVGYGTRIDTPAHLWWISTFLN